MKERTDSALGSRSWGTPEARPRPGTMMPSSEMMTIWTLQSYRSDLNEAHSDDGAEEALDELEKSIVAKLADDVLVGVKGDRIDLVIKKKF